MCGECAVTTEQSSDKFPRYLNEVVCNGADRTCFTVPQGPNGHGHTIRKCSLFNIFKINLFCFNPIFKKKIKKNQPILLLKDRDKLYREVFSNQTIHFCTNPHELGFLKVVGDLLKYNSIMLERNFQII